MLQATLRPSLLKQLHKLPLRQSSSTLAFPRLPSASYASAALVGALGASILAVPLYKAWNDEQQQPVVHTWTDEEIAARLATLQPVENAQLIRVKFEAQTDNMDWTFTPVQSHVSIVPGETALGFFVVTNRAPVTAHAMATYEVHPPQAARYLHKIQCFCFQEQSLGAGQSVDMPAWFYLDPAILQDPTVDVSEMTLSYTFHAMQEDDTVVA